MPNMPALSSAIFVCSIVLDTVLIFRMGINKCYRRYRLVFVYVCYTLLVMDLVLFAFLSLRPTLYQGAYWKAETLSMSVRFLVVWEIFHDIFREAHALSRTVSRSLVAVAVLPIMISGWAFWSLRLHQQLFNFYFLLERTCDFVQAFLVLSILLVARYYHIGFGKNVWGVAVGFGAYVSASTCMFAIFNLDRSFAPFMQVLSPLSFVSMLAVWTWALWDYSPSPAFAASHPAKESAVFRWWEAWVGVLTLIKRNWNL